MPPQPSATSVLLIDGSKNQRAYWIDQLKSCLDYEIVEASDGQAGLDLYRARRIDCVVLKLGLPDQSGFEILGKLVQVASKPLVPVIAMTRLLDRGIRELAQVRGAYACLHEDHTTGEDLHKAIQEAVAFVGQIQEKHYPSPLLPPSVPLNPP